MSVSRTEMETYLAELLEPAKFRDYCPNGLQVEGRSTIGRLVTGVTACQALIDAAIECDADAILVHHGYFWRGEDERIRGMKKRRLHSLLVHDISLFAYHLPLDAHYELGNNATLARLLGFETKAGLDADDPRSVGNVGRLASPMSIEGLLALIEQKLGRTPQHIGEPGVTVERIAWCTGGAQSYIEQAVAADVEVYLTGEISEPTVHTAREEGIHFIAAGHHATERYGVQAVGEHLAEKWGIEHRFIDIDNPV